MELKQFVKQVLNDVVSAVAECKTESSRRMYLASLQDQRTVEFDVAVIVDEATSSSGKGEVKVFSFIEGDGEVSKEARNSSVSRVKFGVYIDPRDGREGAKIQTSTLRRTPEVF